MRARLIAAAVSAIALIAVTAGSSVAGTTADETTGMTAPTIVEVVEDAKHQAEVVDSGAVSPSSGVHAPTCFTAFAPPSPDGIMMYQYYRNCNGMSVYVFPGYQYGGVTYRVGACVTVPDGWYTFWRYDSTVRGATYGTFYC